MQEAKLIDTRAVDAGTETADAEARESGKRQIGEGTGLGTFRHDQALRLFFGFIFARSSTWSTSMRRCPAEA
jgi:hypothetical protein